VSPLRNVIVENLDLNHKTPNALGRVALECSIVA
jgi:hypothetical protein